MYKINQVHWVHQTYQVASVSSNIRFFGCTCKEMYRNLQAGNSLVHHMHQDYKVHQVYLAHHQVYLAHHQVYLVHHFHVAHHQVYLVHHFHLAHQQVYQKNFLAGHSGCSGLGALLSSCASCRHHTQKHRIHTGDL